MRTTTVRFDDDEWADLERECERLDVSKAAYIRGAVRDRIAGSLYRGALAALVELVQTLTSRVTELEREARR